MDSLHTNSASDPLNRAFQLREAVLWLFCDPLRMEYARLLRLSRKEWKDLLRWLDTSGLALYFFDRLEELDLLDILPPPVLARLTQNLADNIERMDKMAAESVAIQRRFQDAGLSYAVLKGFSLWPISVPKPELRSQLDLDFLVGEKSAMEARRILEDVGYRLTVIAGENGKSWQFESTEYRSSSLKHLYKSGMRRSTDLHIEPARIGRESRLSRTRKLSFHGVDMPVLAPLDLFVGQGLHAYQHVCCEFVRAGHLIEFRRHIVAHRDDGVFWSELREQLADAPETCVRLGMVILLISRVMGSFAPEALTRGTVDRLPPTARLWVDKYGSRIALASYPGSKLYLLLQEEMKPIGLAAKRSRMRALVPKRLPPAFVYKAKDEILSARMKRYCKELHYVFFRLRFHLLEGMRYLFESVLWRQYRNGVVS